MKCKHCDGDGVIVDVEYGHAGKYGCKYCDGKGVVEPLTNEEWLKSANTEQLAEWLQEHMDCVSCGCKTLCCQGHDCKPALIKWLKQPHTERVVNHEKGRNN